MILQESHDFLQRLYERTTQHFDAIPCVPLARLPLRWDSIKKEFAALSIIHQSLVKDGWKIVAQNIVIGEIQTLGFIEADSPDRSLRNISLPDGDYEISVLTSSLFWQDCMERDVRTISVGDAFDWSPLPLLYHVRSSVSNGVTAIQWSATSSGAEDCIFGLWYSADSPVPTDRPPDETVWYFSNQSEYQATFRQREKCYGAVASMRTGNKNELGTVHELFLDWNDVPPRAPDDVIVFEPPLPALDTVLSVRHQNEPELILWQ